MVQKRNKTLHIPFFILSSLLLCLVSLGGSFTNADIQIDPSSPTTSWENYTTVASGAGTVGDPYIINSAPELAFFANQLIKGNSRNFYGEIVSDIDLGAHEWFCKENLMAGVILQGNNHVISNLYINEPKTDVIGLFAYHAGSKISNLSLSQVNILGDSYIGAFFGRGGTLTNCHVLSGSINGKFWIGGLSGDGANLTNCSNYATITSFGTGEIRVAGLAGGYSSSAVNCMNFGDVICYNGSDVSGLVSTPGAFSANVIQNCYVECTLIGFDYIGGISASGQGTIQNCGFRGKIIATSGSPKGIGALYGGSIGTMVPENSFGIAEITLANSNDDSGVLIFGFKGNSAVSSYNHCMITKNDLTQTEIRKYTTTTSEINPFIDWVYSPYVNGGYPFPSGMFAVGNFLTGQNIKSYLNTKGFDNLKFLVRYMGDSTYGTNYYVEMGKYPQTYVGSEMNTTLEGWYSGRVQADTYTVDNGTSATSNVYNAFTYTDGTTYVRVPTPSIYSTTSGTSRSIYEDGTFATTSATWFKVEPIRWLILNYADFQNGAAPVVIAEKGLTAKVTWNKATSDQNLWSETSNIRNWLNGTFYNDAFGYGDKEIIVETILQNNSQSSENDGTGVNTTDKVWLLSNNEAFGKYFATTAQRLCAPTDFAVANNCYLYTSTSYPTSARPNGGTCYFWLRSAYPSNASYARVVFNNGALNYSGVPNAVFAARPALTLNV